MENNNEDDAVENGEVGQPGAKQTGGGAGVVTSSSELDAQWHRVRSRLRLLLLRIDFHSDLGELTK